MSGMFGGGFRLGKVLGFDIDVDWSWLLVFVLVVFSLAQGYFPYFYPQFGAAMDWVLGAVAAVLLFASVLAHELTHSVVARRNGIEIKGITLFIFGGVSQTRTEPATAAVEFKMAVVGPAMSFALALVFWLLGRAAELGGAAAPVVALAQYLAFINLLLGAFNMAPGFPLDGGRALRSVIWAVTDDLEKATRYSCYAGQAVGYALMGMGALEIAAGVLVGGLWFIFIGWFLAGAARTSYQQVLVRQALSGIEVERIMTTDAPSVGPDVTVEEFVEDYLMRHEFAAYPVVEEGCVKGVVGAQEVRQLSRDRWPVTRVFEIAHPVEDERKVGPHDDAWQALTQLMSLDTNRLLVMEDSRLDGVVTRENIFHLARIRMQLGV